MSGDSASSLKQSFPALAPVIKTIQLELSGGGAHGAYECGVLEVLLPFWKGKGFEINLVTGVSAGAMNAALLSYIVNSEQEEKISSIMGGFWDHVGRIGDLYLKPFLDMHHYSRKLMASNFLTNTFNVFSAKEDRFPNIPGYLMNRMQMGGKSSLPLQQLKEILAGHIPASGWDHVRDGKTETFIGSLLVDEDSGAREPVMFTGAELSPDSVLTSAALRDFAPYKYKGRLYEDGGYHKIGFFMPDRGTDVLFAIGLKPLRDAAEIENKYGVKTGQLHHDLARYHQNPDRATHIDFICLDHPEHWNESSAMNNTSRNLNSLREQGRIDALKWIEAHGRDFGIKSSFQPSEELVRAIAPQETLEAA